MTLRPMTPSSTTLSPLCEFSILRFSILQSILWGSTLGDSRQQQASQRAAQPGTTGP